MSTRKQKHQINGFIDIHLVLIAGVISGLVIFGGFRVYNAQKENQANKQLKNNSASLTDSQKALSAEEQKKLSEAQNKSDGAGASNPAASTASDTVKPKTTATNPKTSTTAPKTWAIVHPSASTCSKGEFTIYSSISGGTPYYNYYNRAAIVQGTLPYKASKVVRCENTGFGPYNAAPDGPTGEWLEFGAVGVDGGEKFINLNDVSLSAPPN